jgi:hypothetical protein
MMLRLQTFSGIAPKLSRQLLPENMARDARNCRLLSGELRGIGQLRLLHDFENPAIRSAFRLPDGNGPDIWVGFTSDDVDFLDAPLINDAFERYCWTGSSPQPYVAVNTKPRLRDGLPAYRLGVPFPANPPLVGAVTGGTVDRTETRAYIYTFINEWGEESAPSPPFLRSGPADGSWPISQLTNTPPDMVNRVPIVKRRIYRTVTGQASSLYYFVADVDIGPTTFTDDLPSTTVVQNNLCNSFSYDPPPDNLKGLLAHPAGFLVGFAGNEIFCSVPYRSHAWPVEFILAVEHPIVGLAIYGNTLMVLTTSNPYYIGGSHPSNLSPTQSQSVEPCLSKRSIASTLQGVLYASPNGLVLFNEGGAQVVTNNLISKKEWQQQFIPQGIKAAQYGMQYLAFRDTSNGFEYSPAEPLGALSTIDHFKDIANVQTDRYEGTVIALSNGIVYEWDNPDEQPIYFTWRSKEFDFPRPLNFGACIVKAEPSNTELGISSLVGEQRTWNETRIQRPLNPLGYTPIAGSRWAMTPTLGTPDFNSTPANELEGVDRRQYPVGGSPLWFLGIRPGVDGYAFLRVFADRRLVATLVVFPNTMMRLPSGFKAHYWQFELISNANTYSIAIAETGKELMNV